MPHPSSVDSKIPDSSNKVALWGKRVFIWGSSLAAIVLVYTLFSHLTTTSFYAGRVSDAMEYLPKDVSPTEAIVVLTGDRFRIPKALELLRARRSPLLVISGAGRGISLKEVINQQGDAAVNIHENWDRIVMESNSTSTLQNAYEAGKVLREKKITQAILVTSEFHMDRSLKIFRRALPGISFYAFPVASDVSQMSLWEPNRRLISGFWFMATEWGKRILFQCFHQFRIKPLN